MKTHLQTDISGRDTASPKKRLLITLAVMIVGARALAVEPLPEVSATKPLGSSQSYTLKVTDAPSATGYAGAGTDGTIYVLVDQAYTFNIKATENSNVGTNSACARVQAPVEFAPTTQFKIEVRR